MPNAEIPFPELPALNLPPVGLSIRETAQGREVFDSIRGKYVALTPEEWVRQHMIAFLVNHRGVPPHLMAVEISLKVNRLNRRCDILVYGKGIKPLMIIELKAPQVSLNQNVLDQVVRYNLPIGARYLLISNGIRHYALWMGKDGREVRILDEIPGYDEMCEGG